MAGNELAQLNEDLRNDQLKEAWQRFGPFLLLALVALVIGTAVWSGWNWWTHKQQEKHTQTFAKTLDVTDSAARLATLRDLSATSTAAPAQLALVGDAVASGDRGKMAKAIADMKNADNIAPYYRELAVILQARLALDGDDKLVATALNDLNRIAADDKSAWMGQAVLYQAILKMRQAGEVKEISDIADAAEKKIGADKDLAAQLRNFENFYLADRPN